MEKELTEILEQLRYLTAKVEALLDKYTDVNAEPVVEPEPVVGPEPVYEPERVYEPEPVEEIVNSAPIEITVTSETVTDPEPVEVEEPKATVMPEIQLPAVIRFSLNDRFRFQRTIFGNSPERMANAMTAISAMTTADEVYAYLTNVLNRDVNDPDVEDFFREVTLRFSDHKPLII